jgi:hypothetical protein
MAPSTPPSVERRMALLTQAAGQLKFDPARPKTSTLLAVELGNLPKPSDVPTWEYPPTRFRKEDFGSLPKGRLIDFSREVMKVEASASQQAQESPRLLTNLHSSGPQGPFSGAPSKRA